jgi:hypothetical protein
MQFEKRLHQIIFKRKNMKSENDGISLEEQEEIDLKIIQQIEERRSAFYIEEAMNDQIYDKR